MRCYLIAENKVRICPNVPNEIPSEAVLIGRVNELDPKRFPVVKLLALYNALPGIEPVKRFADRQVALKRVWGALENLPLGESRPDSKADRVLRLLRRPEGCDITGLIEATQWQAHSVRGFLSGTVRKKQGLIVHSQKIDGRRVYRIDA